MIGAIILILVGLLFGILGCLIAIVNGSIVGTGMLVIAGIKYN